MRDRWMMGALLCACVMAAASAMAQDDAGDKAMQDAMDAWAKSAALNEHHARMGELVGAWNATTKFWMNETDEPGVSKGKCKNDWMYDKRYLAMHFDGEFAGMSFSGYSMMGYDNVEKRYFSTWMDSMSTGLFVEYGQYDDATKTYTFMGSYTEPTGEAMKSKSELVINGHDKHTMTMYKSADGEKWQKSMEIVYERVASPESASASAGKAMMATAACGQCIFKMDGVKGCKLAVKIDGTPYLVEGANISAHAAGLCGAEKKAKVTGDVKDGVFVAKTFELQD